MEQSSHKSSTETGIWIAKLPHTLTHQHNLATRSTALLTLGNKLSFGHLYESQSISHPSVCPLHIKHFSANHFPSQSKGAKELLNRFCAVENTRNIQFKIIIPASVLAPPARSLPGVKDCSFSRLETRQYVTDLVQVFFYKSTVMLNDTVTDHHLFF